MSRGSRIQAHQAYPIRPLQIWGDDQDQDRGLGSDPGSGSALKFINEGTMKITFEDRALIITAETDFEMDFLTDWVSSDSGPPALYLKFQGSVFLHPCGKSYPGKIPAPGSD